MDGHRKAGWIACLCVNMMAAFDSFFFPTFLFKEPGKVLSRDTFHTAISSTLSLPVISTSLMSMERHASTAS